MQYSFISAAVLALASSVLAQNPTEFFDSFTSPVRLEEVPAGKPFTITWQAGEYKTNKYKDSTATIVLLQGPDDAHLVPGPTVASKILNSLEKYTWDVPSDLESHETYGFTITLDGVTPVIFQYSFPFHITGLSEANTTTSSTTGAASGYPTATGGTTTVHLGTGSAYTVSTSKPTTQATYTSANSTTVYPTTSKNVTVSHSTPKPSSNFTISTVTTAKPTTTGASGSATSSGPAQQTANAAFANVASGSLALFGGLALAFAL